MQRRLVFAIYLIGALVAIIGGWAIQSRLELTWARGIAWGVSIGLSVVFTGAGVATFQLWHQCRRIEAFLSPWRWFIRWVFLVIMISGAGALAGLILYPLVGLLFDMDYTITEMILNGLGDGGFYAFIWAPGLAFVLCFIRGYRHRLKQPESLE